MCVRVCVCVCGGGGGGGGGSTLGMWGKFGVCHTKRGGHEALNKARIRVGFAQGFKARVSHDCGDVVHRKVVVDCR